MAAVIALATAVHRWDIVTSRLAAPICVIAAGVAAALLGAGCSAGEPEPIRTGIAACAVSLAWFAAYRGAGSTGRPPALRVTAAVVALGMLSGLAWMGVTEPGRQPPGVPVIATGGAERVLVVPQRTGWNPGAGGVQVWADYEGALAMALRPWRGQPQTIVEPLWLGGVSRGGGSTDR